MGQDVSREGAEEDSDDGGRVEPPASQMAPSNLDEEVTYALGRPNGDAHYLEDQPSLAQVEGSKHDPLELCDAADRPAASATPTETPASVHKQRRHLRTPQRIWGVMSGSFGRRPPSTQSSVPSKAQSMGENAMLLRMVDDHPDPVFMSQIRKHLTEMLQAPRKDGSAVSMRETREFLEDRMDLPRGGLIERKDLIRKLLEEIVATIGGRRTPAQTATVSPGSIRGQASRAGPIQLSVIGRSGIRPAERSAPARAVSAPAQAVSAPAQAMSAPAQAVSAPAVAPVAPPGVPVIGRNSYPPPQDDDQVERGSNTGSHPFNLPHPRRVSWGQGSVSSKCSSASLKSMMSSASGMSIQGIDTGAEGAKWQRFLEDGRRPSLRGTPESVRPADGLRDPPRSLRSTGAGPATGTLLSAAGDSISRTSIKVRPGGRTTARLACWACSGELGEGMINEMRLWRHGGGCEKGKGSLAREGRACPAQGGHGRRRLGRERGGATEPSFVGGRV